MDYLYLTDDVDKITREAREYASKNNMFVFVSESSRDSMEKIKQVYETMDNIVILLFGLNKSNVSNALLKLLEDNKKNIVMFATSSTYDVNDALLSRFVVINEDNIDINKEVEDFIKTRKAKKDIYSSLNFYISLANHTKNIDDLYVINNIIKEAQKCTYNTPWDYYFSILKEKYKG